MLKDLLHAVRTLRRSPGYTLAAGLALAIGIGANTALFSVVDAILLRPLPFADSERLVAIRETVQAWKVQDAPLSTTEFGLLRQIAKSYESLGAYESVTAELSGIQPAETLSTVKMTAGLFEVLGNHPLLGRTFGESEDFEGSTAALISYNLWQRRFGGDRSILGRTITLDRRPRTILGVMPRGFVFPQRGPADNNEPADVYIPMGFTEQERQGRGPVLQKSVIGRLRPAVPAEAAQSEAGKLGGLMMARISAPYATRVGRGMSFSAIPLREEITGHVGRILWLLMGAVGVLLLIACANVANLSLTRAAGRQRERAIRAALGASRGALVRLMLSENLVLAAVSGMAGLLLAAWGSEFLAVLSPVQLPRSEEVAINGPVCLFTLVVTIASALLSGIAGALPGSAQGAGDALKDGGRTMTAGRSRQWLLSALVSAQFALTVMLLIAGSLMLRSLLKTIATDPGFRPEQGVAVTTHLPPEFYDKAAKTRALYLKVAAGAENLPGVKAAGVGTELPLGNWEKGNITAEGSTEELTGTAGPLASQVWVTGHYLEALGAPLRRGRFFSDIEYRESRHVVVISETLARKLWPGGDAVGRRLRNSRTTWETVIGVVGDIKEVGLNAAPVAQIYEPHSQLPDRLLEMTTIPFFKTLNLVSRSDNGAATQMRQLAEVIQKADPSLAISGAEPLDRVVWESGRSQRMNTFLMAGFGGVACLLAVLGVAGVLGYSVVQRTNEIGIRMALGATPQSVSRMVVHRGLGMACAGIAVGLVGALGATRLLSGFLYGVSARDPLTFVMAPLLLAATAVLAAWAPANRAARVDPLASLRAE